MTHLKSEPAWPEGWTWAAIQKRMEGDLIVGRLPMVQLSFALLSPLVKQFFECYEACKTQLTKMQ